MFLSNELFPSILKPSLSHEELARHELVHEFERVISYLEETDDQTFHTFELKNNKFTLAVLEKIFGHWVNKCRIFKRNILRKNWKEIL